MTKNQNDNTGLGKKTKLPICYLSIEEIMELCEVSDDELDSIEWDNTGAKYSEDGTRLLKVDYFSEGEFVIREGTKIICNNAFDFTSDFNYLTQKDTEDDDEKRISIIIPTSVECIGNSAFACLDNLFSIDIPSSVFFIGKNAFECCRGLDNVSLHPGLAIIGEGAFYGCYSLYNFDIPTGVKRIEKNTFEQCWNLRLIILPTTITSVSKDALDSIVLTHIYIPKGSKLHFQKILSRELYKKIMEVDDITANIFDFPVNEEELNRRCSVSKEEESDAEWDDTGAKYNKYGSRLLKVDEYAVDVFFVKEGTQIICNESFLNCKSLKTICISDGVKRIGNNAFNGCSELTSIDIPPSVVNIGENIFANCEQLSSIYIEKGTKQKFLSLIPSDFHDKIKEVDLTTARQNSRFLLSVDDYKYFCPVSDDEINSTKWDETIAKYSKDGKRLIKVDNDEDSTFVVKPGTKSICDKAFCGYGDSTSVIIHSGLMYIGDSAFAGCSKLSSVVIPSSVIYIAKNAFDNCNNLKSIYIKNGTKQHFIEILPETLSDKLIEDDNVAEQKSQEGQLLCFSNVLDKELDSIEWDETGAKYSSDGLRLLKVNGDVVQGTFSIRDGVQIICNNAFETFIMHGVNVTSVTLPGTVTVIGKFAFVGCEYLTSINIPISVTRICAGAFECCRRLNSIQIPSSVVEIGKRAFWGCKSIASVSLPTSINTIESYTFKDCPSLTDISIPASVTSIGDNAFSNCSSLTSITIPSSVICIEENAFSGCKKLSSIIIAKNSKQHFMDILPVELHSKLIESDSVITEKHLKPDTSKQSNNNKKHNTMYCNNCGKEIPDGSKFCNYCGAKVGASQNIQIVDYLRKIVPNTKLKKVVFASIVLLVIGLLIFRSNTIYGKWQCIHTFSNFYYTDIYEFNLDGTYVCAEYWSSNNSYGERTGTWDNDDGTLMLVDSDGEYPIQYYKIKDIGFNHLTLELLGDEGNILYEFERK